MKPKTGKNHSQSQEPRKSAQDAENDFHDHVFSLGREPGIPRGESGGRLKRTRMHVGFSVFFGLLWDFFFGLAF
jgi:hypothetical protein